jgi:uncharacterized damage-inducible protein DinB
MRSEITNLLDELKKIHEGNAWHGPALREILAGVTAEQAAARPIPNAHTIWELILHITAWENVFFRRLEGESSEAPEEGDFPPVERTDSVAWEQSLAKLESTHERLMKTISSLSDSVLTQKVAGKDYSVGFLLRGIAMHHVYHAGQIALLKRCYSLQEND